MSFLLLFLILLDVSVFVNATATAPGTATAAGTATAPGTATAASTRKIKKLGSGVQLQIGGTCWAYSFSAMLRGLGIAKPDAFPESATPGKKRLVTVLCEKYGDNGSVGCIDAMMKDPKPTYPDYQLEWPTDLKGDVQLIDYNRTKYYEITRGYGSSDERHKARSGGEIFSVNEVKKYLPSIFLAWQPEGTKYIWNEDHFMPKHNEFTDNPRTDLGTRLVGHGMALVDVLQFGTRNFLIIKNSHDVGRNFLGHICVETENGGDPDKFKLPHITKTGIFRFTSTNPDTIKRFEPMSHPFERMEPGLIDFIQQETHNNNAIMKANKKKLIESCKSAKFDEVQKWIELFPNADDTVKKQWSLVVETRFEACEFCETGFNWYRDADEAKRFICWAPMNGIAEQTLKIGISVVCTAKDGKTTKLPVKGKVTEIVYRDTVRVKPEDEEAHVFNRDECLPDQINEKESEIQPVLNPASKKTALEPIPEEEGEKDDSVDVAVSGGISKQEFKRVASMKSMKEFQDMHIGFIVASIISVFILVGYLWQRQKVEEPTLTSPLLTV